MHVRPMADAVLCHPDEAVEAAFEQVAHGGIATSEARAEEASEALLGQCASKCPSPLGEDQMTGPIYVVETPEQAVRAATAQPLEKA